MPSCWVYMIDFTLLSVLCLLSIINWVMYKGKSVFSKTPWWAKTSLYIILQLELFTPNFYFFEYCTWVNIAPWRDIVRIHFCGIGRNPCMLILFLLFQMRKLLPNIRFLEIKGLVRWRETIRYWRPWLLCLSQYFSYGFKLLGYRRKCPSLQ